MLGESVLAGTLAISTAIDAGELKESLIGIVVGALLVVFAMWWLYFERPTGDLLTNLSRSFEWGYGHYFIWGAAAAVGAGFAVAVDVATHHAAIDAVVAGYALAVPVAVYVLGAWVLHDVPRPMPAWRIALSPIAAGLVLLAPLTAASELLDRDRPDGPARGACRDRSPGDGRRRHRLSRPLMRKPFRPAAPPVPPAQRR